jgi:hypothetical protein
LRISNTTISTSTGSGALVVNGGIGAAGNVYVGGNVYGNLSGTSSSATSLTAATSILAGSLTVNPASVPKTSVATETFALTGLTTSHKVNITCGTALTYGIFISAAWASAADTLSIQFTNLSNGAIDLGNINLQYFAWV